MAPQENNYITLTKTFEFRSSAALLIFINLTNLQYSYSCLLIAPILPVNSSRKMFLSISKTMSANSS